MPLNGFGRFFFNHSQQLLEGGLDGRPQRGREFGLMFERQSIQLGQDFLLAFRREQGADHPGDRLRLGSIGDPRVGPDLRSRRIDHGPSVADAGLLRRQLLVVRQQGLDLAHAPQHDRVFGARLVDEERIADGHFRRPGKMQPDGLRLQRPIAPQAGKQAQVARPMGLRRRIEPQHGNRHHRASDHQTHDDSQISHGLFHIEKCQESRSRT